MIEQCAPVLAGLKPAGLFRYETRERADLARRKKNYSVLLPKLKETFEKNIAACGNGK